MIFVEALRRLSALASPDTGQPCVKESTKLASGAAAASKGFFLPAVAQRFVTRVSDPDFFFSMGANSVKKTERFCCNDVGCNARWDENGIGVVVQPMSWL